MSAVPQHLALIPDGNRRWAKARGLTPTDGHREGIRQVGAVARAAFDAGVQTVTFWWGSPANLTLRDPIEVEGIVGALHDWLRDDAPELLDTVDAGFSLRGRWRTLCPSLAPVADALRTRGDRRLVGLMAYDGREEILDAVDRAGGDTHRFREVLWTADLPPVDLLVRTGGEPHLSAGFMAWALADAQLLFPEAPWPAWGPSGLAAALEAFAGRGRRFGR